MYKNKAELTVERMGNEIKNCYIFIVSTVILVMKEESEMVNFFLLHEQIFSGNDDGLVFSVANGEATVTGYIGEPESVIIPDFYGCYPVTEMRDNAFYNCESLTDIIISSNVRIIGHHCFYACSALERVDLPTNLCQIGSGCFCGCDRLEFIVIPETLKALPDSCFRACLSLEELILPSELESIGDLCFSDCESMIKIDIGRNIKSIGGGAFYMCRKLNSIHIPPTCEIIGAQALGFDCDGNELVRKEKFLIEGADGSIAQKYASENGFDFSVPSEATETFVTMTSLKKSVMWNHKLLLTGTVVFAVFATVCFRCLILHKRKKKG